MTLLSQNGWTIQPPLDNRVVPGSDGVKLAPGVRAGDVADVLFYCAARYNLLIERLVPGWCWGYNYRNVRGSTATSNHSSGTAVDFNAPRHPLGKRGTYTDAQRAIMKAIAYDCRSLVRFGELYSGRVDGMHLEVLGSAQAVSELAAAIRAGHLPGGPTGADGNTVAATVPVIAIVPPKVIFASTPAPPPVVEAGMPAPAFPLAPEQYFGPRDPLTNKNSISGYFSHAEDLHRWQDRMRYRGWKIAVDSRYGPETHDVAVAFQRDKGLPADGLIGPITWSQAWLAPITR